jgi:hydroxyethylthiazole kinase-like uncharacterized protein yjeF
MKIFSAQQISAWDAYTILEEPITSIALMERAAQQCTDWLLQQFPSQQHFSVFCGKGNNGGDGLAIARQLAEKGKEIQIHILEFGFPGTDEFQQNLARLHFYPSIHIQYIQEVTHLYAIPTTNLVIDALYGSGLNRKLEGLAAKLVEVINQSTNRIVSIDIPSGMFCDQSSQSNPCIRATHTLSFTNKFAFFLQENIPYLGKVELLDIGLHPNFYQYTHSLFESLDIKHIQSLIRPRKINAHKGSQGHALLCAGSFGKIGAAILAAKGAIRGGLGLLTCHVPACGTDSMQIAVPEAITFTDNCQAHIKKLPTQLEMYKVVGIGPGIGLHPDTMQWLTELLKTVQTPIILDADALNILALHPSLLSLIPKKSILTPHPKEFQRLFGETVSHAQSIEVAMAKAKELDVFILLKGYQSFLACPSGPHFFNTTGNAGMARGGAGDVLTGLLTGLVAQGYNTHEALQIGVFLHGLAGDIAAQQHTVEGMSIEDLLHSLGAAWKQLIPNQ